MCAHLNFYSWYNCEKAHEEPEGMAWLKQLVKFRDTKAKSRR